MNEIIPAILTNTKRVLNNKLKKVEGLVKTVQIDIMDGKFVKNKSIGLDDLPKTKLRIEAHLMVKDPWQYVDCFDKIYRVIFHLESFKKKSDVLKFIKFLKKRKKKVGIAINPKTRVEKVKPFLDLIDSVLIMTVTPGASGQKFKKQILEKVKKIKKWSKVDIGVDGGVNEKTMIDCLAAGANLLCMGSAIYSSRDIKKTVNKLDAYL